MSIPDRIWLPDSIDAASRANPRGWLAEQRRHGPPQPDPIVLDRDARRRMQRAARKQQKGGGRR